MQENQLPSPCYIIDEKALEDNLKILKGVSERTGAKILLAQKAFSTFALYPLIGQYLDGTCSSGIYEAMLGKKMNKPCHVFSAAYRKGEVADLAKICSHIVFNSFSQLEKYGKEATVNGAKIGLRINPECSTQGERAIYDPCAAGSRLGVLLSDFPEKLPEIVSGLHFHTLCEQNSDDLEKTLNVVEEKFDKYLRQISWINFGGGHHITKADYDIATLEKCIRRMQDKYGLQVYLEPGEAVALNAGSLMCEVLDIVHNSFDIAILDTSAACHMPDVIEMPYRPPLKDSARAGERAYTYRLSAPTCLAGDIIGDYSFDKKLTVGDKLYFEDMAIYTMVKNNTFNGMPLPSIAIRKKNGDCEVIKTFSYADFENRLS